MSKPDLGLTPEEGSRVPVGAAAIDFAGLPAGSTVQLAIGTSPGDSDVLSVSVVTPAPVPFVFTAGPLYGSAWATVGASTYAYGWAWAVGDPADAPEAIEREAIMGYLKAKWKRSALAGYAQGLDVPDPGHGLDEITPISYYGLPFNVDNAGHVAPFTSEQVKGTGYLQCLLVPTGDIQVFPGCPAEYIESQALDVIINTPNGNAKLAGLYASVLQMLFRNVTLSPNRDGVNYIRNIEPVARPLYRGDSGAWRVETIKVPLQVQGVQPSAGTH